MLFGTKLERWSVYGRTDSRLTERTACGGALTLVGTLIALILFFSEVKELLRTHKVHEMTVFTERLDRLSVQLDLTLLEVPCHVLAAGANLGTGERVGHVEKDLEMIYLDADQRPMPNVPIRHGPVGTVASQHQGVKGCRIKGELHVGRIAGTLQFIVQATNNGLWGAWRSAQYKNMSHYIARLGFGPRYKGMVNPLEGTKQIDADRLGSWKYFLKVVPTTYQNRWGSVATNQYSVTEFFSPETSAYMHVPFISITYEMSPYSVRIREESMGIWRFLVRICAVVGGTYAFTSMLDRWIYQLLSCTRTH